MGLTLPLVALAVVLCFALMRPRGWPEAIAAVPAAAVLIAASTISLQDAAAEVSRLVPVVGFLAAVLVLARLCDDEGLFRAAGELMARAGNGDPRRLLAMVFAVASVITAVLSLDATVVLLTPVVVATARRMGVSAKPHAYATAHLANTASLLLPVSNLTNLLAFSAAGLSFLHFAGLMTLPWLLAIAVELALFRWLFRGELVNHPSPGGQVERVHVPVFVIAVLGSTLLGFAVTSPLGVSPAWAALAGALILGVRALAKGDTTISRIVGAADLPFLAFVLCLGVVVEAVMRNGLDVVMRDLVPAGEGLLTLLGIAAVAAVLSNLVNNLPAVLVMLPLVATAGPAAVLAVLIGVNIGPNLSYPGSLANLLWRNTVRRHDVPAGFVEFTRIGLCTVPVTLTVSVVGLWLGVRLFGT
ncbi:SLC13 family permease [Mycobacterium sp. B14F4]|uniref:SLC13 family permease n=1 Tax=Mycobacterium sp. B14F4 TaxID=3153565 RepID=UPI00325DC5D8